MTRARPDLEGTPGGLMPCVNCRGHGWKYVTTRHDRMMAALGGITLHTSRRICLDCTGTGVCEQADTKFRRAG
jgi:hypothetical protein